jgi:hypothetical protein
MTSVFSLLSFRRRGLFLARRSVKSVLKDFNEMNGAADAGRRAISFHAINQLEIFSYKNVKIMRCNGPRRAIESQLVIMSQSVCGNSRVFRRFAQRSHVSRLLTEKPLITLTKPTDRPVLWEWEILVLFHFLTTSALFLN